ncbi:MAG: hypothetical protein WCD81_04660 [Candidatus Bathyarchaeia archaeon]
MVVNKPKMVPPNRNNPAQKISVLSPSNINHHIHIYCQSILLINFYGHLKSLHVSFYSARVVTAKFHKGTLGQGIGARVEVLS